MCCIVCFDEMNNVSEIAKNTSEAAKNFQAIIDGILQPRGLDIAILEGHKKIIESFVERNDIDEHTKIVFLSNYKKMVKEYRNCKTVMELAKPLVSENAKPHEVEEDWFAFFFDKVRLVSDESVQMMWSKILANEINTPGTFQRSLLHTLSVMSTAQAQLFCNIARFCMFEYKQEEVVHPLLFISSNVEAYKNSKITASSLLDLENLGLIQCDFKSEYIFPKKKVLRYGNKVIEIYGDPDNDNKIKAGNVRFTYNGRTLFSIVESSYLKYRTDILDFAVTKFQRRNCKVIINNRLVT